MPKNKLVRRKNYQNLREAGYNSREADKYKDRAEELVQFLIDLKRENSLYLEERIYKALSGGK